MPNMPDDFLYEIYADSWYNCGKSDMECESNGESVSGEVME